MDIIIHETPTPVNNNKINIKQGKPDRIPVMLCMLLLLLFVSSGQVNYYNYSIDEIKWEQSKQAMKRKKNVR